MSNLSDFVPNTGGSDQELVIVQQSEAQTATENQTVFNLQNITYRTGYDDLQFLINGIAQVPESSSYTENSTTRITTSSGLTAGDRVVFSVTRTAEGESGLQRLIELQTATAGQTLFYLTNIQYRLGYQDLTIEINGVTQEQSPVAYTESSNSNQVTFLNGLDAGDRLCFSILRII